MLYRLASLTILVCAAILFSGCAAHTASPALGRLITDTSAPLAIGEGKGGSDGYTNTSFRQNARDTP